MTAQMHEKLIFDGEESSIAGCPDLPENHPNLIKFGEEYWRPGYYINTACWRKYVGTWEVRDGRFYLSAIEGLYRLEGGEPIFAE